jgi:hypothetical protein
MGVERLMTYYDITCETCGGFKQKVRDNKGKRPRFCSRECKAIELSGKSLRPIKHIITPEMHSEIRKIYQNPVRGERTRYARKIGIPLWAITKYAMHQGWMPKQKKEPDWNGKELKILERNAHLNPTRIQVKLKQKGFKRTINGIVLKRKKMRLLQNLNGQSAASVADCFGVSINVILRAIKGGRLKATRRETNRTGRQGKLWYIKDKDIKEYVLTHLNEIDVRKVDKYWFVDILTANIL